MSTNHQLTISSNTLFHFTDKIENVINILENEFRPHYSLENLNFVFIENGKYTKHENLEHAFPMICFCDIPLSQAKNHMETYGHFGIGLKKEWGIKMKISPVLYSHRESNIMYGIAQIWKTVSKLYIENNDDDSYKSDDSYRNLYSALFKIYSMTKPYDGKLWDKKKEKYKKDIVRFYNEREWRFIPEGTFQKRPLMYGIPKKSFLNKNELEKFCQKDILKFEPSDIKYIIVEKEGEIIDIIKEIERIKSKYDDDQKKLLCSRVISAEQILEDF